MGLTNRDAAPLTAAFESVLGAARAAGTGAARRPLADAVAARRTGEVDAAGALCDLATLVVGLVLARRGALITQRLERVGEDRAHAVLDLLGACIDVVLGRAVLRDRLALLERVQVRDREQQ